jgi:serine/threonine protein kinase/tetratricopeptide (TPR) repeat protein
LDEKGILQRLAESVADGAETDWAESERSAMPSERGLVRQLRLVHNIAELYRSLPPEESVRHLDSTDSSAAPYTGMSWAHFVLRQRLGSGVSSDVFRAWDTELRRDVTLKLVRSGSRRHRSESEVIEEARRLARLHHHNIVQVFGATSSNGLVGLWAEYISGCSLEDLIRTNGPMSAQEAAIVGESVAAALAAVHNAGLLHRDLKAQNVLREDGGRILLVDFGTGANLQDESNRSRLAGTPLYMAPEVLNGAAASMASDIYSVGVLLFYLTTGRYPVVADSLEGLVAAHAHGQKRLLLDQRPDLPISFVTAIERCLQPSPLLRFRTAGELGAQLRDVALPGREPRESIRSPKTTSSRGVWATAIALVGTVAVLVLGIHRHTRIAPEEAVRRIAVLPFADLSRRPTTTSAALTEGLSEEFAGTLSEISGLVVVPPFASRRGETLAAMPADVSSALHVDAILRGTVLMDPSANDLVRMEATLVAGSTGTILWADSEQEPLNSVRALQTRMAKAMAQSLGLPLSEAVTRNLVQKPGNLDASEESFLRGRTALGRYGLDEAQRALAEFQRAILLDPSHARARAAASLCYVILGTGGAIPEAAARASATREVERALRADPDLPEAHAAKGDLKFFYDWDWDGAEQEYRRALEINPSLSYAHIQYARFLAAARRHEAAAQEAAKVLEIDPIAADAMQTSGLIDYYGGRYDEAVKKLTLAGRLDPGFAKTPYVLGRVYEAQGRFEEALQATGDALKLTSSPAPSWRIQLLRLTALNGRPDLAQDAYQQLLRELESKDIQVTSQDRAYFELAMGNEDEAVRLLQKAVREHDPGVLWFAVDPRLAQIRGDGRFKALLSEIGVY